MNLGVTYRAFWSDSFRQRWRSDAPWGLDTDSTITNSSMVTSPDHSKALVQYKAYLPLKAAKIQQDESSIGVYDYEHYIPFGQ